MSKKYFNWRLAVVLVIFIAVAVVTVIGMRKWQKKRLTYDARQAGLSAYKSSEWEKASENFARYLAVNPTDIAILFNYAQAQVNIRPLKSENIHNAIATYRKILRIDKNDLRAADKLVTLYLQMNIASEAELIARRILKTKDDPQIRTMLAMAMAKQRKFDQASEQLKEVIEKYPKHVLAYEVIGKLSEKYPEHFGDTSRKWFNKAVEKNPDSAQALIARGSYNLRSNDLDNSLKDLEEAEQKDLSDIETRLTLVSEFIKMGLYDKAESHLLKIEADHPQNPLLWQTWGQLALKRASKEEMFDVAQAGLKRLDDWPWDFLPLAAELYIRSDRFQKAGSCLEKLSKQNASPSAVVSLQALLAKSQDRDHEAIILYRKAQKLGDNSPRNRQMLIDSYLKTGDKQTAISELRKLLFENPDYFKGHLDLAKLLAQSGNWTQAAQQAKKAVQLNPDDLAASLFYLKTQIQLIQSGSNTSGYTYLENELIQLDRKTNSAPEVRLLRFQLAMRQGKFEEAEKIIEDLHADCGELMEVGLAKVDLLIVQKKYDQAIDHLYMLLEQCPESIVPIKYLSALLEKHRKKSECKIMLENAISNSGNPIVKRQLTLLLANLYYKWHQDSDAYQLLTNLSEEMPFDIPIKRYMLRNRMLIKDGQLASKIIENIKSIEGPQGWQWKYEQAKLWMDDINFKKKYPQIISLLQQNISENPNDQSSRLLLAQAYEKAGDLQLALAAYRQIIDNSPYDLTVIAPAVSCMYKAREFSEADKILDFLAQRNDINPEVSKLKVNSCLRQGDFDSAGQILESLLKEDPENHEVQLSLALLNIRQRKFKQAKVLLDSLKENNPDSLDVFAAQVDFYTSQKMNDRALDICDQLVAKRNDPSSYILRGKTLCAIGKNSLAEQDFDKALQIDPNEIMILMARSDFYRQCGNDQKALEDIKQVLRLDPENLHVLKQAIEISLNSGRGKHFSQGKDMLKKAFKLSPHDTDLKLYKAQYLLSGHDPLDNQQGLKILHQITQQYPANTDSWQILARYHLSQKHYSKTIDTILNALVLSPGDPELLLLKAQAEAAHSPDLAIPTLKILHEKQPQNVNIVMALARTHCATENYPEAVQILTKKFDGISLAEQIEIDTELAVIDYKMGNKSKAIQKLESLYQIAPDPQEIFLAQADLLIEDDQWEKINQIIAGRLTIGKDKDNDLAIELADRLAACQNDQALRIAESLLNKAVDSDPDNLRAMSSLAVLMQSTSKTQTAQDLYEKILKVDPDNLLALNNLAWIYSQGKGKHLQALALVQRGLQKAPNYLDLVDTRGVVYECLGENQKAAQDFAKCIELYPENSSALAASHFHLAKTQVQLGLEDQALDNLQKTMNLSSKVGGLSPNERTEAKILLTELTKKKNYEPITN